tara:strand:+ start:232 stop:741 length:510 start_codon:yes stop_codon:yes gene_type:complete
MHLPPSIPRIRAKEKPFFEIELRPHRSLSLTGFSFLIATVSIVCFTVGWAFLAAGAWPVFGFFGLEVVLLYMAFRLNYRSGRLVEMIRLDREKLVITQCFPNGRFKEWRFAPFWVRVTLDTPLRHKSKLFLSSHGRYVNVGSFLTSEERNDVAVALRTALAQWRESPEF